MIRRDEKHDLAENVRRLGIDVAGSVNECLDVLSGASEIKNRFPLMDRVKRLLGVSHEG